MQFNSGDRGRLVQILRLNRRQDRPDSLLDILMHEIESDDALYNTNYVEKILNNLALIDQLEETLLELKSTNGIKSVQIDRELSVQFDSGSAITMAEKQKINQLIQQIKNWLDPDRKLDQYSIGAIVVPTL